MHRETTGRFVLSAVLTDSMGASELIRYEAWGYGPRTPMHRFQHAVFETAIRRKVRRLCDVGAGANPLLNREQTECAGVSDYVLTDISTEELEKAPRGYQKAVTDITRGPPAELGQFDMIVTHTVAEHVVNAERFHRAINAMLRPGGCAMHFFPTFYEPAFVFNRILPEAIGDALLSRFQPGRERGGKNQKFPALYHWCRGPTTRQLRRLRDIGFEIEEYVGVFGHGYFDRFGPLNRIEQHYAEALRRHPVPALTSYAWVRLQRPLT